MAEPQLAITAWLLAGGEGRRVHGQDKGLLSWHHAPLAWHVLHTLANEAQSLGIIANRNHAAYAALLQQCCASTARHDLGCRADNADWPPFSGPAAGMLTALPLSPTDWVAFAPCDTPQLPPQLFTQLRDAALAEGANVAVPVTIDADGSTRHHWVCAIIHKRAFPKMLAAFVAGERKVRQIIATGAVASVSFGTQGLFANFNTLETLHGGD